jgi:tight adherence protein B
MTEVDWTAFDFGGATGYVLLVLMFAAFFLAFEAIFLSFARRTTTRKDLSRRVSSRGTPDADHAELIKARRRRSLSAEGEYTMHAVWLNRLIVQSGVHWGAAVLPVASVLIFAAVAGPFLLLGINLLIAIAVGIAAAFGIPLMILAFKRDRRRRKFEDQLPEAIDVLVRSLRAGHPVSAAIRMVVREMPDPLGGEFRIVSDEMTYGLDLETAMNNLSARVGQPDLALAVVAVGIQSKTGGNLAEVLSNLSKLIRDRSRMRLKIRSLSAEGRFSAIVLTVLPVIVFTLLNLIAPHFYGDVWASPLVKPLLAAGIAWMIIGDIIMYRMVKLEV